MKSLTLNKKIVFTLICIFSVISSPKLIFAVWDGSPYDPGEIDNPECLPSQTNCDVLSAVTAETDPVFTASEAFTITGTDTSNWDAAYSWGDHTGLYDLLGTASGVLTTHENTYDHSLIATALQSETDPLFTASSASGITNTNISNWNTAYGWGNHANAGYLTSASLSGLVPYTGAVSAVDLGAHNFTVDTNTLFVDSTNHKLGVGTVAPNYTLTVKQPSNSTSTGLQITQSDSASSGMVLQFISNDAIIKNRITGGLALGTNDVTRLYINSSGNVGIGTTSPGYPLDVSGEIRTTSNIQLTGSSGVGIKYYTSAITFGSNGSITYNSANNIGHYFNGSVGIGTTSPSRKLQITQANDVSYPTLGTAKGAFFIAGDTNLYGLYTGINTGDGNSWFQAMRNDSAVAYNLILQPSGGNVGIGTTSPTYKLDVNGTLHTLGTMTVQNGNIALNGGNTGITHSQGAKLQLVGDSPTYPPELRFFSNSGEKFTVKSTGNVGIGTNVPTAYLHIKAGTATAETAPLKFTSGTLLTTPEAGAVEFDGTNLYYTDSTPTRQTLVTNSSLTTSLGSYVPYTGATSSVNLGTNNLTVDTNTLFVDSTNHQLGIGTVTPTRKLSVVGGDIGLEDSSNRKIYGKSGMYINFYNDITGGFDFHTNLSSYTSNFDHNVSVNGGLTVGGNFLFNGDLSLTNGSYIKSTNNYIQLYNGSNASMIFKIAHPTVGNYQWLNKDDSTMMFLNRNNNLSIGSSSSTSIFEITQPTLGYGTVATNGTTTLTGTNTQFTNTFKVGDTITVSGETVRTISSITSNTVLDVSVAFSTTASGLSYTLTGGNRFAVKGNGNVGIGTTSPAYKLDVNGTISTSGIASGEYYGAGGTIRPRFYGNNNGTEAMQFLGPAFTNTSGTRSFMQILPSYNQTSGTSSNIDILINRTETAVGSGGQYFIQGQVGGSTKFNINHLGGAYFSSGVGIGIASPTAYLNIDAGTATAGTAPLKFTSGTLLTTPEVGAVEFDGTNLYYTDSTPTRQTLITNSSLTTSLGSYVPYTGATGAVTLGANTLSTTSGLITPKIYPESNSTTAFQINKADGTTNVMNVDTTNGRVGIGTTSPITKLDVVGSGRITGAASSTLTGTADPTVSATLVGTGTLFTTELIVGDRITINSETRTVTAIASDTSLTVDSAFSDTASASITKLPSIFVAKTYGGTNSLVISDIGTIGIGGVASTSTYKLRVYGAIWADSFAQLSTLDGSGGVGRIAYYDSGSSLSLNVYGSHSSENVKGIVQIKSQDLTYSSLGTSILHADSNFLDNPSLVIRSRDTAANSYFLMNYHQDTGAYFVTSKNTGDDASIRFKPNNIDTLYLGDNGNVGINTISPSTILEIGSSDLGDGVAGPIITLGRNTNTTNTGAGSINFLDKAGTNGYVWQDAAGNLRINTSAPSNANDTAGVVVGAQTSVRTTKQDIEDYTDYNNALTLIVNAPLHTFRYIKEVNGYGTDSPLAKTRIGYIADEVDPIFMIGNVIDQVSVNGLLMASVKELNLKLESIAVPIDETKEQTFTERFFAKLIVWFGSSDNGLERICVKKSDGTEFCVNGDQLEQAVNGLSDTSTTSTTTASDQTQTSTQTTNTTGTTATDTTTTTGSGSTTGATASTAPAVVETGTSTTVSGSNITSGTTTDGSLSSSTTDTTTVTSDQTTQ